MALDPTRQYEFDIDDFTLGELEDFEEHTGVGMEAFRAGELPLKAIRVLVWITERRENPDVTLDECRDVKLAQIAWDEDPKDEG